LVGIFILFADVFAPLQTNQASGAKLVSPEPIRYTIIECLIFASIVLLAWKAKLEKTTNIVLGMTGLFLVFSLVYLVLVLNTSKPDVNAPKSTKNDDIIGNVYHFVLDEMQTDALRIYLNEKNHSRAFPGFTLYKHNNSNYTYTHASFPSYFTGTVFKGGYFEGWRENFRREGLLKGLSEKGYDIAMYPPSHEFLNPFAGVNVSLDEIFMEETGEKDIHSSDFIRIWFARTAPNFLSNESLSLARTTLAKWREIRSKTIGEKKLPRTFEDGKSGYASVLMWKKLIREESARSADGRYLYAHAMLPHSPFVIDENGAYHPGGITDKMDGYYGQLTCVMNLVSDFLDELKRLGRYEKATIVIHSDTGHGPAGFIKKENGRLAGTRYRGMTTPADVVVNIPLDRLKAPLIKEFKRRSLDLMLSRTMAVLMVKPAGAPDDNLAYSDRVTQLIDITPTLAELLKLDAVDNALDGRSLYSKEPLKRGEPYFFWTWRERKTSDFLRVTISNPENSAESKLIVNEVVLKILSKEYQGKRELFDVGSPDENGLVLEGFTKPHTDGAMDFRVGVGPKSKITFKGLSFKKRSKATLLFFVKPFLDEALSMKLATSISSAEVTLEPGSKEYAVSLEFPAGDDPRVDVYYKKSGSPGALERAKAGEDYRVYWDTIDLIY
ncbi:MAG: sulfatase-like hydrolase/transferase, partial [Desulfobacterales bacterium]|nr:sulfatase-like hydrolase/transferase [Desulfobacterales bacterium]